MTSGMKQTFKSNTFEYKGLRVPRIFVPKITPYILWRDEISLNEAVQEYRNLGDLSLLKEQKESETLAILGSGASINELTDSDFDFIDSIDSLALNWWGAYHNFVPDFYSIELSPPVLEKWAPRINKKKKNIQKRRDFDI